MTSENQNFTFITKRLPDHQLLIEKLYKQDDLFMSLCDDYLTCLLFLQKVDTLELLDKSAYKKEYKLLLSELEKELEDKINSIKVEPI